MELKSQVCSLPLARQLKELGVKQESFAHWWQQGQEEFVGEEADVWNTWSESNHSMPVSIASAFTAAELGEMLPVHTKMPQRYNEGGWFCEQRCDLMCAGHDTEADARAEMLIYLIQNDLIASSPAS